MNNRSSGIRKQSIIDGGTHVYMHAWTAKLMSDACGCNMHACVRMLAGTQLAGMHADRPAGTQLSKLTKQGS